MIPTEEQVERGAKALRTLRHNTFENQARACLVAAFGDVVVPSSPSAEDVYACAKSTLLGFREELTERNIEFICDQISRKATMPLPSAPDCGGVNPPAERNGGGT